MGTRADDCILRHLKNLPGRLRFPVLFDGRQETVPIHNILQRDKRLRDSSRGSRGRRSNAFPAPPRASLVVIIQDRKKKKKKLFEPPLAEKSGGDRIIGKKTTAPGSRGSNALGRDIVSTAFRRLLGMRKRE